MDNRFERLHISEQSKLQSFAHKKSGLATDPLWVVTERKLGVSVGSGQLAAW